jgi:molecular chaperone HscB
MQQFDFSRDYFKLFGLNLCYRLDSGELEVQFRALQSEVHPDKSAHLGDAGQRLAMQRSTLVNEAYQTLKSPIRRARYLLSLQGVDTQEETNTVMPVDFLMAQMDLREAVEAALRAQDMSALDKQAAQLKADTRMLEAELAEQIDTVQQYQAAAGLVRKLCFMEKLAEEIASAYDELDN